MGDISAQLALKERMKCKSFDWFMKEVAYDVFEKYPRLPPNQHWGELRNEAANLCLDTHGRHPPEKVVFDANFFFNLQNPICAFFLNTYVPKFHKPTRSLHLNVMDMEEIK